MSRATSRRFRFDREFHVSRSSNTLTGPGSSKSAAPRAVFEVRIPSHTRLAPGAAQRVRLQAQRLEPSRVEGGVHRQPLRQTPNSRISTPLSKSATASALAHAAAVRPATTLLSGVVGRHTRRCALGMHQVYFREMARCCQNPAHVHTCRMKAGAVERSFNPLSGIASLDASDCAWKSPGTCCRCASGPARQVCRVWGAGQHHERARHIALCLSMPVLLSLQAPIPQLGNSTFPNRRRHFLLLALQPY